MLSDHWLNADGRRWRICSEGDKRGEALTRAALDTLTLLDLTVEIQGPAALFPEPAWLKGSALKGKTALRHGLRFRLGLGLPRLREAKNLAWLARHLFVVPKPLVGLVLFRAGLPRGQWLVTQEQQDARPLLEVWDELDSEQEQAALTELAREVARMHALGFTHRDLFLRNLMWRGTQARKLLLLDCWRGGPGFDLRGASWDVGCLLSDLVDLVGGEQAQRWLTEYLDQRAAQDRPVAKESFIPQALKARRTVIKRLIAQPQRLGSQALPRLDWIPDTWE